MPKITPTLLIGLGGTGQSVLFDVRRRIVSRFNGLENMPLIKFVAIDTDVQGATFGHEMEEMEEDIRLRTEEEYVHCEVPADTISHIRDALERNRLRDSYPFLYPWLSPEAMRLPSIDRGAGQVRQLGRLGLLMNWSTVQATINSALTSLASPSARAAMDGRGLDVGERTEIYVIASLMGGTGAGMFLDLGYMLRYLIHAQGGSLANSYVTGVFAPPEGVPRRGDADNRAIAYACLQELNHLNDHGTTYDATWPDGNQPPDRREPPYHYTMLTTVNNGQQQLPGFGKLTELVGQLLFMRATSEFNDLTTATRANILPHQAAIDEYGNNQHFACMGFSSIEVPVETIVNTCAYRLARDAYASLLGPESPGLDEEQRRQLMAAHGLDIEGLLAYLMRQVTHDEAGPRETGIVDTIRNRTAGVVGAAVSVLDSPISNPTSCEQHVLRVEAELAQLVGTAETSSQAREIVQANLQGVGQWSYERMVAAVNASFAIRQRRVRHGMAAAKAIAGYYEKRLEEYDGLVQHWRGRVQDAESRAAALRRQLGELLRSPLFFAVRAPVVEAFLRDVYVPQTTERFEHRLRLAMHEEIRKALERMLAAAGRVQEDVREVLDRLQAQEASFEALQSEAEGRLLPINGEVFYERAQPHLQIGGVVAQEYDKHVTEDTVRSLAQEILVRTGCASEADGAADIVKLAGFDDPIAQMQLRARLVARARDVFGAVRQTNVLQQFFREYKPGSSAVVTRITNLYTLSLPFLVLNRGANGYVDSPAKWSRGLALRGGIRDGGDTNSQVFLDSVRRTGLIPWDQSARWIHHVDEPYQVFFYQEYGAFPIRLYGSLTAFETAYTQEQQQGSIPLHAICRDDQARAVLQPVRKINLDEQMACFIAGVATGRIPMQLVRMRDGSQSRRWELSYWTDLGQFEVERLEGSLREIGQALHSRGLTDTISEELRRHREKLGDMEFLTRIRQYGNMLARGHVEQQVDDWKEIEQRQELIERYIEWIGLSQIAVDPRRAAEPWRAATSYEPEPPRIEIADLPVDEGLPGVAPVESGLTTPPPPAPAASVAPPAAPTAPQDDAGPAEPPAVLGGPVVSPSEPWDEEEPAAVAADEAPPEEEIPHHPATAFADNDATVPVPVPEPPVAEPDVRPAPPVLETPGPDVAPQGAATEPVADERPLPTEVPPPESLEVVEIDETERDDGSEERSGDDVLLDPE